MPKTNQRNRKLLLEIEKLNEKNWGHLEFMPYLAGQSLKMLRIFEPYHKTILKYFEPSGKKIALVTMCSHSKPYSKSWIHQKMDSYLSSYSKSIPPFEKWHISSGGGMVPAELEQVYPFCAYDWNSEEVDEQTLRAHRSTLRRRFENWLEYYVKRSSVRHIILYTRGGGNTGRALKRAIRRNCDRFTDERGAFYEYSYNTKTEMIEITPVWVKPSIYVSYVVARDVDDVLVSPDNLSSLLDVMRQAGRELR